MTVVYREVRDDEIAAAVDVHLASHAEMAARYGMQAEIPRDYALRGFAHLARTGIFRVAETEGRLVSLCAAILRGDQWFLSSYWTLPGFQGRGIGQRLLDEVHEQGQRAGAATRVVWSSPDYAAIASYLKLGMLPGFPLLLFTGEAQSWPVLEDSRSEALVYADIAPIDREARGAERAVDHGFWRASEGVQGRQVRVADRVMGYFYLRGPVIAPAGWVEGAADAVLGHAIAEAAASGEPIRLVVPGANHRAIQLALRAGLRLSGVSQLLWSAPVGRMGRYIPSGGYLF